MMNSDCPSETLEIDIGFAADTGFTKILTGYGVDSSIAPTEALTFVESKIQEIMSLVNLLYVDEVNVFIRIKDFEVILNV